MDSGDNGLAPKASVEDAKKKEKLVELVRQSQQNIEDKTQQGTLRPRDLVSNARLAGNLESDEAWKAFTEKEIRAMDVHECRKHLSAGKCSFHFLIHDEDDPLYLVTLLLQLARY